MLYNLSVWVLGQHDEAYRKIRNSILNLVGNTPLVRLRKVIPSYISPKVEIYAKLESFNPGGSVKDRPALSMFLDAIEKGLIKEGKVVEGVISQIKLFNAGSGWRTLTCVLVYVYAYAIGYSYYRRGELEV